MIPMHYLHQLSLDLNTWYINVDKEAGEIGISSITAICFKLDRQTFESPNITATITYASPTFDPEQTFLHKLVPTASSDA